MPLEPIGRIHVRRNNGICAVVAGARAAVGDAGVEENVPAALRGEQVWVLAVPALWPLTGIVVVDDRCRDVSPGALYRVCRVDDRPAQGVQRAVGVDPRGGVVAHRQLVAGGRLE